MKPTFTDVRLNYSTSGTHDCGMHFPNTCAIRMSEALVAADPSILDQFKASEFNLCPHGYVRGAQDLAAILRQYWGTRDKGFEAPGNFPSSIKGKRGVVCYMNIPTYPDGQGHIDLWDKDVPVDSAYWDANPIWFWELA